MEAYPPDRIRNVALLGHSGAGKTTLAEALLHHAGALARPGRVEDGTTVCDFEPEEVRHGVSLALALAPFELTVDLPGQPATRTKVNLLDVPGSADFAGEATAALAAADLAVLVVSAVDGVEVGTRQLWERAAELRLPRMIFVNKLERDRADFDVTLDALREAFGAGVAPLELPLGEAHDFSGVVDLLTDTAFRYAPGDPVGTAEPVPDDMAHHEHAVHDALVEGIVVGDDALLERYLEGEVPSYDELEGVLADGVARALTFPVLCGSAIGPVGVDRLARLIVELGPSPLARPPVRVTAGDTEVEVAPDPAGDPLAVVFRTIADPYVGHVSLMRVLSGTIRPDDHLVNSRSGADERLHALFTLRGKEQVPVDALVAGDLGAVAKLTGTATGDTLAPRHLPVHAPLPAPPEPVMAVGIAPRTTTDDDRLATALHRLCEEDPSLRVERVAETSQTLLRGLGETHLAVTLERLARRFAVEVVTEEVRVAYRETPAGTAEAEGRYKKQSGGHGQFGVARVRVEPLPRGAGFEFVDAVVGGAIPRNLVPAVERGVEEAMASGGLHGHPVTDVRVTCLDGKHHTVDSSEMSFKMAGALAFREALAASGSVVLEPVSLVEVTAPVDLLGEVMGDLNARRGRVQGTEALDGAQRVSAFVPTSELGRYAVDLRSLSGGRAAFRTRHDHHDPVPEHLVAARDQDAGR
jgi:elongation factor G